MSLNHSDDGLTPKGKRRRTRRRPQGQTNPEPLQMTFAFDTPAATPAPIVAKPNHVGSETCPDCGAELRPESRCFYCPNCGYSKCPTATPQEDELEEGETEV